MSKSAAELSILSTTRSGAALAIARTSALVIGRAPRGRRRGGRRSLSPSGGRPRSRSSGTSRPTAESSRRRERGSNGDSGSSRTPNRSSSGSPYRQSWPRVRPSGSETVQRPWRSPSTNGPFSTAPSARCRVHAPCRRPLTYGPDSTSPPARRTVQWPCCLPSRKEPSAQSPASDTSSPLPCGRRWMQRPNHVQPPATSMLQSSAATCAGAWSGARNATAAQTAPQSTSVASDRLRIRLPSAVAGEFPWNRRSYHG